MNALDWTKWSAVAEIASSIAILVTLVYLAIQTAQNTAAVQASTRQSMLAEDRALLELQIAYPDTALLQVAEPGSLSDEQIVRIASWLTIFVRNKENQYLQFRNGVIDEGTWRAYSSVSAEVLSYEITRRWWESRSAVGEFDPSFTQYVNELLATRDVKSYTVSEAFGLE